MAGGVGARFWPLSKTNVPKQFIDILGSGKTLIQQTFDRFKPLIPIENIFVVTNDLYRDIVFEQLPELPRRQVLCEPYKRNTAPCIAYASYKIAEINPLANIVVSPADHHIENNELFLKNIETSLNAVAANNWLMTLGIRPTRPDTGYGYIQYKDIVNSTVDSNIKHVKTFTEKPILEIAKSFIQSGDFLWNSGIFIWNVQSILHAFEKYLPELNSIFLDGVDKFNTTQEQEFINQAYQVSKPISIDYGIMEKADNVYTIVSEFMWSDLGTYGSLYDNMAHDDNKNAIVGNNIFPYDTKNCIIHMPADKLVVLDGLDDYIVVESDNVLMVCRKSNEQQIKQFVNDVKHRKGEQFV